MAGLRFKTCRIVSPGHRGIALPRYCGIRGSYYFHLVLAVLLLTLVQAGALGPKRVLILYSFGRGFAPPGIVGASFQTELAERSAEPIEFHELSLESPRLVSRESAEVVVSYLRALFGGQEPDLIVPCGAPAVGFALEQRARLFPSTPLLLTSVELRHLSEYTLDTNTVAVSTRFDIPGVIENALRLWPGTTNVVVVQGKSSLEVSWKKELERDFERFANQVRFTWLDPLSFVEMLDAVAEVPPHTIIFYASLYVDAAGVPFEQDRAIKAIHASAKAPIIGLFEEDLGRGIVGGPLIDLHDQGLEAAVVGMRILNGQAPGNISSTIMGAGKPQYDWRELKRWGVDETRLEEGSQVHFREVSFAKKYRGNILAGLCVCAIEAALILELIRQLHRRRRTERLLRSSEERMKLAVDAAKLNMWEWDIASDAMWVAEPTEERTGAGESRRLNYSRFLQTVHPDDRTEVARAVELSLSRGADYDQVHRRILSDGQIRWVAARGRVEFNGERKPLRMRGVSLDITARKQAEAQAQESEERFLLIANAAPVLIWTSGPDKLCTFCNKRWLEFTGRTLDQELGNGWSESIHAKDLEFCMKLYSESFDARQPFRMEYRLRRRDGQYRWISDYGVPRYDAQNLFMGYIGSCVDVTERKEAEADADRSRQELAHVGRVATLGELAGSLAHELNQPLTAILSNAQAAQRFLSGNPSEREEVGEILKDIVEEGCRAGEVISRVRAMLKKDQGLMLPHDLNLVAGEVLRLMRSDLAVRHITVVKNLTYGLPMIKGDRIQLQQVLLNLILNACEAMNEIPMDERQLTLETKRARGDVIQVSVADCGPGFAPDVLPHIFEPFRTTKANGLGLGLPICRSIISAHGGRLWAVNNRNGGATLSFTLAALKELEL